MSECFEIPRIASPKKAIATAQDLFVKLKNVYGNKENNTMKFGLKKEHKREL